MADGAEDTGLIDDGTDDEGCEEIGIADGDDEDGVEEDGRLVGWDDGASVAGKPSLQIK